MARRPPDESFEGHLRQEISLEPQHPANRRLPDKAAPSDAIGQQTGARKLADGQQSSGKTKATTSAAGNKRPASASAARHPLDGAGALSKLFFGWMLPFIWRGWRFGLTSADLPKQTSADESCHKIGDKLVAFWAKELEECAARREARKLHEGGLYAPTGSGLSQVDSGERAPSLARAVLKAHTKWLLLNSFIGLFAEVGCKSLSAYSVGQMLIYMTSSTATVVRDSQITGQELMSMDREPNWLLYWTLALVLSLGSWVLSAHFYGFQMMRLGVHVRVGCSYLMYRKSLRLALGSESAARKTMGRMTNLLTNDLDKFNYVFILLPMLWLGPIQTLVSMALLWPILGPSCLGALLLLLILTPIHLYLSSHFASFRRRIAQQTDERVSLMSEMVNSLRLIKFYAWEYAFQAAMDSSRKRETDLINRVGIIKGASGALMYVSSKLILFVTLLSYSLLFGGHLDARTLFMSMALLNNVQFTMTQLMPRVVSLGVESLVSLRRIGDFLLSDELPASSIKCENNNEPRDSKCLLSLNNLSARWPNSETQTLANISISFDGPKLVAICGQVASGKSSLLLALLGELPVEQQPDQQDTSDITVGGSMAYCSQLPWIFAGTIRDNILFGRPMDAARYHKVIEACALEEDLQSMANGDLTYIHTGALSGGQRARLNLARCLYGERDIYLLDDPLSALDGRVAARVFELAIRGLLADKLVLLATHKLELLQANDQILVLDRGEQLACCSVHELSRARDGRLSPLRRQLADSITKSTIDSRESRGSHLEEPQDANRETDELEMEAAGRWSAVEREKSNQDHGCPWPSPSGRRGQECAVAAAGAANRPDGGQVWRGDELLIASQQKPNIRPEQSASESKVSTPQAANLALVADCKVHGDGATYRTTSEQPKAKSMGSAKVWLKYYKAASTWRLVLLVLSFLATQATYSSIDVYLTVWSLAEQNRALLGEITGYNQKAMASGLARANGQPIGYDLMSGSLMELMVTHGKNQRVLDLGAADDKLGSGVSPLSSRSSADGSLLFLPTTGGFFVPLLAGSSVNRRIVDSTSRSREKEDQDQERQQVRGQNLSPKFWFLSDDDQTLALTSANSRPLIVGQEETVGRNLLANGSQKVKQQQQAQFFESHATSRQPEEGRQNSNNNNNNDKPDHGQEGNTRRDDYDKSPIGRPTKATTTWLMADEDILRQSNQALNVNSIYRPLYLFVNNFTSKDHALTYGCLLIALSILSLTTNILFFTSSNKSAISLYKKLTDNALFAKVNFFDSNPIGGLMNRASRDIGIIDEAIPYNASQAYDAILKTLATFVMVVAVNLNLAIPSLIMLLLFVAYHSINIHATKDIQRLEGSLKSPIITHLGSSIAGLHTIRASQSEGQFESLFVGHQDAHTSAFLLYVGLNRATAVYLDCLNALYTACLAFWAVVSGLSGPSAGLVITSAMLLAGLTQHGVMKLTETESLMTSVERVIEYCNLPQEDNYDSSKRSASSRSKSKRSSSPGCLLRNKLIKQTAHQQQLNRSKTNGRPLNSESNNNPELGYQRTSTCHGKAVDQLNDYKTNCLKSIRQSLENKSVFLEFRNVDFYYNRLQKPVLKNISFKLDSGERVAIVGRTGAGKSSIITTLFRLYDFEGSVLLEGRDTRAMDLLQLRQFIGIIPQTPILFSTTIRKNLDPYHLYDDFALWQALGKAHLRETISALPGKLDFNIGGRLRPSAGGNGRDHLNANGSCVGGDGPSREGNFSFSTGQKQLMCLARVLLRQNRLIVMDEATANVDPTTDAIIQSTIRREFKQSTLITIAHRLETIIDYDRIMVLEAGRIVDFDTPERLMAKKGSYLADMMHESGTKSVVMEE